MLPSVWNTDASEEYIRAFDRQETYIPFRPADLCLLIVRELNSTADKGALESNVDRLIEFNRRLTYSTKLKVVERYDEWQDSYVMLDPDVDVVLHESHTEQSGDKEKCNERFQRRLKRALHDGSFEKLTEKDFNEALNARSVLGLDVALPNKTEIQYILFSRGRRIKIVEIPDWTRLWLMKKAYELKTYQRVVLLLRRDPQGDGGNKCAALLNCLPIQPESTLSKSVKPEKMYLKIYKDIEASDVDMLIPGSKVQFTNLDFLFLVVPLLLGLISAVWKAIDGTLDFNTMQHAMTSAALVILPLTYAARAYLGFRNKRNAYQANLIKKLSLQTVANNSGALTSLLDEVADQETMDALLAYAFLWKGRRVPLVTPRSQLAEEVEEFLNRQLREHNVDTRLVFNVKGACDKLEQMGLFQRYVSTPAETLLQVVDIGTAADLISAIDISKKRKQDSLSAKRLTSEYEDVSIEIVESP